MRFFHRCWSKISVKREKYNFDYNKSWVALSLITLYWCSYRISFSFPCPICTCILGFKFYIYIELCVRGATENIDCNFMKIYEHQFPIQQVTEVRNEINALYHVRSTRTYYNKSRIFVIYPSTCTRHNEYKHLNAFRY